MNSTGQPAVSRIGLPPEQFSAAFPFHLALDRKLKLIQAGATIRRICPDVQIGADFSEIFRSIRPEGAITPEWIQENSLRFFLLEHRATGLQLRGEFMLLPDEDTLLFLGSPWFVDSGEIAARGLGFEDFAIHDPVVDMLQVFQASKVALGDAKKLAAKLTAQRTELRAVNERLRQQEADGRKLALIAARTDNAVVLTDASGQIEWVNEGFTRLTGYSLDEVRGKKPGRILQGPESDPATIRFMRESLKKGQGFSVEMVNYSKSGKKYWLAIEVQAIRDEQGRIANFMAIETDITARRAAQQRLALQLEVSRVLTEAMDLATGVGGLLRTLCENLGWQVGQIWKVGSRRLEWMEAWQSTGVDVSEFVAHSRSSIFERGVGLPGRVWAASRAAWVADVTDSDTFPRAAVAAKNGLRGAFAFPVQTQNGIWGVVECFSHKIEEPDDALLNTISAIGNQIGQFIVRLEAQQALRVTNTLQEAILNGANYSIISTSPDGIIRTFNAAAERMLGYRSEEMVGRRTPAVIHDIDEVTARAAELSSELGRTVTPGFETFIAKASLGKPDEREWTYVRKDGGRFPVLLSVTALFDENRVVTGYLGVASDITERKRVAIELLKAKESAESANRAKGDFLAVMSHEMRTPLNAILGMTNLLLQSPLDPKQREFAETSARSGEDLLELINDILDFSKIESGEQIQLEEEDFSLRELVDGVMRLLRSRADAMGLSFTAEVSPKISDRLRGDDGRVRQVLLNLVGNAIKFTDRGAVIVRVMPLEETPGGVRLRFEVQDSGIGIRPEDQGRLFQPFTQADSSSSRRRGGTGLGLAISKRIVERMGGRIGLESAFGRGSLFWFELPLRVDGAFAEQQPTQPGGGSVEIFDSKRTSSPLVRPKRILVAEDHDTNRRLAHFMLEGLGQRADFAANGLEAVEAWERFQYDIILMDCQMPEMDGFSAAREIRRRETTRGLGPENRVFIVALTANALKGDRERCRDAGMDGYLSKPYTMEQLREALGLKPPAQETVHRTAATLVEGGNDDFDARRPNQLWTELGAAGVQAITEDFLRDLPGFAEQLARLLNAGKLQELAHLTHSIQGIGRTLGLERLAAQCRWIEEAALAGDSARATQGVAPLPAIVVDGQHALRQWLDSQTRSTSGDP